MRTVRDSAVRLIHNTVYANGGRGVWVDRSDYRRRLGALLLAHNVVQANGSDLTVTTGSWSVLRLMRNVLSKAADGVADPDELVVLAPVFSDPAGADGILGGDGFVDDEFLVEPGSPIVDAGDGTAAAWALERGTVRVDRSLDAGAVDLGYHTP
jgi:hypothetical protein